jgi:hypothetical protein
MEKGMFFEAVQEGIRDKRKIQERIASLEGMIRRGGKQGEDAKKKLFEEFGSRALGIIMKIECEKKKK